MQRNELDQVRETTRRVPKQKRARAKYDAILRAAIQLLSEAGYAQTSTVKIARVAGVSVGTVYAYFPDKDAIFSAYVNARVGEIFDTVSDNLASIRYHSLEEAVRALVSVSVTFTVNNKDSLGAMVGKIPGVYDGTMLRDVMHRLYDVAEAFYHEQGLVQGTVEARRITYTLTHAVTGFFVRMVTDPDVALDKQEMTEELVTLILGYFNERGKRGRFP